MPTYSYNCKSCNSQFELIHKISELDDPHQCPECESTDTERYFSSAPSIGDAVRLGVRKTDNGFKEVLQKIHENTPGSTLNKVIR